MLLLRADRGGDHADQLVPGVSLIACAPQAIATCPAGTAPLGGGDVAAPGTAIQALQTFGNNRPALAMSAVLLV